MDAALHADFGGAAVPGFLRAPHDLLRGEVVGRAAQVGRELALGEGAEAAAEVADVGVVDVAHDGVGDRVADDLARAAHRRPASPPRSRRRAPRTAARCRLRPEILAAHRAIDDRCQARARPQRPAAASVAMSSAGIAMTRPGCQSLSRRRPLAELIAARAGAAPDRSTPCRRT